MLAAPTGPSAKVGDGSTQLVSARPAAQRPSVAREPGLAYAGFWRRFFALTIDLIVAGISVSILSGAAGASPVGASLAGLAIWLGYFVLANSLGQLVGKALLGIKIVDVATGEQPGFGKGALRTLGLFVGLSVSFFTFGFPFLMMLWDDRKRTLHDRIAGTTVLRSVSR